jgi:2-phosphoglycerate kinase
VIYLIGGPPRCGKTTVAGQLAGLVGCSWLPCDYLGSVIRCYLPEEEREMRFPSMDAGGNNDARYTMFSAAEMIAGYRTKARTSELGLQAVIEYAIADERDFILEGFQIEPGFARRMATTFGETRIRSVFLYREDTDNIVAGLKPGAGPNDWVRRNTHEEATFRKIAAMISEYGRVIRAEANTHRLPAFNMDYHFHAQIDIVLDQLRDWPRDAIRPIIRTE